MFHSNRTIDRILSVLLVVATAACGDIGGGCGCSSQPLPGGALPADQTVEGGAQIRVTEAGFTKLTSIIPATLNDSLDGGFCMATTSFGPVTVCRDPECGGGAIGCGGTANVRSLDLQVVGNALRMTGDVALRISLGARWEIIPEVCIPFIGCTPAVYANCRANYDSGGGSALLFEVDIIPYIDATSGELRLTISDIRRLSIGSHFSGDVCAEVLNVAAQIMDTFVGELIADLLRPTINSFVQDLLPDPLGIAGMIDLGSMLEGISPGTEALMEGRIVPGGYVQLVGEGMSLGVITGLNADQDPSTRTPELDSEASYCVPPIPAPDFAAAPASLPRSVRNTFALAPADAFLGNPEPNADIALGLSETTLDQGGHHLVASGAMCLGIGPSTLAALNVGTIGLLVPSLADVAEDGDEPLLLVFRPQRAIDFTIGNNTEASPALSLAIPRLEIDIYAFLYQRYVRAFTMKIDLNVGANLEFSSSAGGDTLLMPTLVGLEAGDISVDVLNSEFVRETEADLEAVLPTLFDLALPFLADGLDPIALPGFGGFELTNAGVAKVTTSQDDFLAITASLGPSTAMRVAAEGRPHFQGAIDAIDAERSPDPDAPFATATLAKVDVPPAPVVRDALLGKDGGRLPQVTFDVATRDDQGRELEWSWNLNGGMWRPYSSASPLVVSDRAFAWQNRYTINLRHRVKGDYRATSPEDQAFEVLIDSVGPRLHLDRAEIDDGQLLTPATDLVTARDELLFAYGRPGAEAPSTAWHRGSTVAVSEVSSLMANGQLGVFVKDQAGNVTYGIVLPFHGQPGEGCTCASGEPPASGTAVLLVLAALVMMRRRVLAVVRRVAGSRSLVLFGTWIGASAMLSLNPGCSCGADPAGQSCEVNEDCADFCDPDQLALCFENACLCTDDVPYGVIGPYSDVALASNGDAYVSAYAESHGDLVVARQPGAGRIANTSWEFVDGVPAGPVDFPTSHIRGGITSPGPDVGMYTSIAVAADDTPKITYFDRDTGSLKYAAKVGGVWQSHIIDGGTGDIDDEFPSETSGLYSSLSLRSDDGRPGVAYMAVVSEGGGVIHSEVRYAAAQTANPTVQTDWQIWTVDSQLLPPPTETDPYPLAPGIGLFADATRDPTQAPVVVYYDRSNGDLKLSRFNTGNGTFDPPQVLDGATSDVGLYPSVAVDDSGVAHVFYQSATADDLLYINTADNVRQLVDSGYRTVGVNDDGLPKPEFHIVGNDNAAIWTSSGPVVAYQDSTTHELLYASRGEAGWAIDAIAGDEVPFVGAYGFFTAAVFSGVEMVISNWVIDQANEDQWVEIHRQQVQVN